MDNKQFILSINVATADMRHVKADLIKRGWIIKEIKAGGKIRLKLYENHEDFDFWKDMACTARAVSIDEALKDCIIILQEKYK